jgi:hypothetical protein
VLAAAGRSGDQSVDGDNSFPPLLVAMLDLRSQRAAVMFYFGWRRSALQAADMGIDESLFGFTAQDYVLRSITSLYPLLLVTAALAFARWWLHRKVVRTVRRWEPARRQRIRGRFGAAAMVICRASWGVSDCVSW